MEIAEKSSGNVYSWVILGNLFMAQLVMSMGAYVWGPLAPFVREAFNVSRSQIGVISSALYVTATVIAIPSGILVDKFGARIMLMISLIIMGGAFVLMALVPQLDGIVLCSAVSGLGYGIINQVSTKGIMCWFAARTRGTAMGIKQTGVTLGGAVSAVLMPTVVAAFSLKFGFFAVGCSLLLTALASFALYKERPSAGVFSVNANPGKREHASLAAVISNPELITVMLIFPLMCFIQIGIMTFLVLYLTEDLRFPVGTAGSLLATVMVAGAAGRVGWGGISDRLLGGNRLKALFLSALIGAISIFCLAVISDNAPVYVYFILSAFLGFNLVGWNAVILIYIAELVGTRRAGSVVGVAITIGYMGLISGPIVFGYVVDHCSYFAGWMMLSSIALMSTLGYFYLLTRFSDERKTAPETVCSVSGSSGPR